MRASKSDTWLAKISPVMLPYLDGICIKMNSRICSRINQTEKILFHKIRTTLDSEIRDDL